MYCTDENIVCLSQKSGNSIVKLEPGFSDSTGTGEKERDSVGSCICHFLSISFAFFICTTGISTFSASSVQREYWPFLPQGAVRIQWDHMIKPYARAFR